MNEALIPVVEKGKEKCSGVSLLTALCFVAVLVVTAVSTARYETKINQLEMRLKFLETESILNEYKVKNNVKPHQVPQHREKREARHGDHQQYLARNDHEETFFTKSRDGSYVRPSGLREIYERLPQQQSDEVLYQTPPAQPPQVRTRSSSYGRHVQPPVQRVGVGADQVSARVVRYREDPAEAVPVTPRAVTVAAHFVADVSNFTSNQNPRLRNSNGIFQIWRPATWVKHGDFYLDNQEGIVTVQKEGIYHIYAQIHYQDEQSNSFLVEVSRQGAPFAPFLQCTTNEGSNSCYSGGLTDLKPRDRILIKNVGVDRFSIYKPEKSFFGLVKVSN